ncbi:MAG: hypothetical protein K5683_03295 [Prevotella sp.]|nr:hypothetical protein [Prevotella sp.]
MESNSKTVSGQRLTVEKDCEPVIYYRNMLLEKNCGNHIDITLTGGDVKIPTKKGQQTLADLRWDYFWSNNVFKDEYYVTSIKPLEDNTTTEYKKIKSTQTMGKIFMERPNALETNGIYVVGGKSMTLSYVSNLFKLF